MRPILFRAAAVAFALQVVPASAAELAGRVVSVQSGDALTLLHDAKPLRVRLAEIDAPELRQSFGAQAREALAQLCLEKSAIVRQVGRDADGTVVGRVECDGVNANEAQVERGMAWVELKKRESRSPSPLYYLEDSAQRSRTGLWSERSPVQPWIYRKMSPQTRSAR
jgi:micrococcal nuclease